MSFISVGILSYQKHVGNTNNVDNITRVAIAGGVLAILAAIIGGISTRIK
jgi:hypothetical protein